MRRNAWYRIAAVAVVSLFVFGGQARAEDLYDLHGQVNAMDFASLANKVEFLEQELSTLRRQGAEGYGAGCADSVADCRRCQPRSCGHWVAGASAYYLKPHWDVNPAIGVAILGNSPFVDTVIVREFDWDYKTSPQVWLGYFGSNGFGVRVRWWEFDHSANPVVQVEPADPAVAGGQAFVFGLQLPGLNKTTELLVPGVSQVTSFSDLSLEVLDFELAHRTEFCQWSLLFSGGVRYARIRQNYLAIETDPGFVEVVQSSSNRFEGWGPTVAVEARRDLGCSGLMFYSNLRASVVYGDRNYAANDFVLIPGVAGPGNPEESNIRGKDLLPSTEVEVGLEYTVQTYYGCLTLQAGLVGQAWFGVGNATLTGLPHKEKLGVNIFAYSTSAESNSNLGLFGGRFGAELAY